MKKVIVTTRMEFDVTDDLYPDGSSSEDILKLETENFNNPDILMDVMETADYTVNVMLME